MKHLNLKLVVVITGCLAVALGLAGLGKTGATAAAPATVLKPKLVSGSQVPPALSHSVEAAERLMAGQEKPALGPRFIPRPTKIGAALYRSLKIQGAARVPQTLRPKGPQALLAPLAPAQILGSFNGLDYLTSGRWNPPDTHGAVGPSHYVEVTNSRIAMYPRSRFGVRKSLSLNSLFYYWSSTAFDPRVVYDLTWKRWVVTAATFHNGVNQPFFIAVSKTSNPTLGWWIYRINDPGGAGNFWDFPMLGLDQDAVIITANVFDGGDNFIDCQMFSAAKAILYNGLGFTMSKFTGLEFSTQPPLVLDQNPKTFLVSALVGDTPPAIPQVMLYTLTNSSRTPPTLDGGATIDLDVVPEGYLIPPGAPQPGTATLLDTGDGRFINAGTQVGDRLFQTHTIGSAYPVPHFYEFDTATPGVSKWGQFYASDSSYDFNASIAANANGDVFLTWTSVDAGSNINAEMRFLGARSADIPPGSSYLGAGTLVFRSPTFFVGQGSPVERWGDYSAVTLDPLDANRNTAWLVNETVKYPAVWSSRIATIRLP
jgi:hypothetical protein